MVMKTQAEAQTETETEAETEALAEKASGPWNRQRVRNEWEGGGGASQRSESMS